VSDYGTAVQRDEGDKQVTLGVSTWSRSLLPSWRLGRRSARVWRGLLGRAACLLAAGLGLWLSPPAAAGMPAGLVQGMAELARHRPRLAVQAFRQVLAERPSNLRAHSGLVNAYASLQQCHGVMIHSEYLRNTGFWQPSIVSARADCEAEAGQWSAARNEFRQSLQRPTGDVGAAMGLARLCVVQGDLDCLSEAWIDAMGRDRGPAHVAGHQAEVLVHMGSDEASGHIEALLTYSFLDEIRRQQQLLRATLARYEGDIERAEELSVELVSADPSDQALAAFRAETFRLAGAPVAALGAMERPAVGRRGDSLQMAVVRSRVLVDLADFDGAERALRGLPTDHPEVVASAWYLARARGDDAREAALAAQWRDHPIYGSRALPDVLDSELTSSEPPQQEALP